MSSVGDGLGVAHLVWKSGTLIDKCYVYLSNIYLYNIYPSSSQTCLILANCYALPYMPQFPMSRVALPYVSHTSLYLIVAHHFSWIGRWLG